MNDIQIKHAKTTLISLIPGNRFVNNALILYLHPTILSAIVPFHLIDVLSNRLDWNVISSRPIPIKYLKKYYDQINWRIYITNGHYKDIETLELIYDELYTYAELFCDPTIKKQYYNKYFLRRFGALIDWDWCIIRYQIPDDIIIKYWDIWNKYTLCKYQTLSDNIISKYKYVLRWDILSKRVLSESIMLECCDYLYWNYIVQRPLSMQFINRCITYIKYNNECKYLLPRHQSLDEEFILKHIYWLNIECVCKYQRLSSAFIIKHANTLNFDVLMTNIYMNQDSLMQLFKASFKRGNKYVYYLIDDKSYEIVV